MYNALLLEFENTFDESKTKAEEALKMMDEIGEMVRNAVATTQEAIQATQVNIVITF